MSLKVATPPTAVAVLPPTVTDGEEASVICWFAVVTRLPAASWISTVTAGDIVEPACTELGCCTKASRAGAPMLTVTCAVPLRPSEVAVSVIVPGLMPVTRPVEELTEAMSGSDDVQLTARPVSALPSSSRMVAVNCCVVPAAIVADGGATVTVLTGTSATETCAEADCPSMVAVTATGPPGRRR
jgi:hypothetical protein